MPARKGSWSALPIALPSHSAAAKRPARKPVLPRVICCPRHLSAALSRWIAFQPWLSFPSKHLRDDSLGRKRICGIWRAIAGRRARRRPSTPTPSFHQQGTEGLDGKKKKSVNFTGTSEKKSMWDRTFCPWMTSRPYWGFQKAERKSNGIQRGKGEFVKKQE